MWSARRLYTDAWLKMVRDASKKAAWECVTVGASFWLLFSATPPKDAQTYIIERERERNRERARPLTFLSLVGVWWDGWRCCFHDRFWAVLSARGGHRLDSCSAVALHAPLFVLFVFVFVSFFL